MKSRILSLLGIGAIVFATACNSSSDESTSKDSSSTTTTVDNGTASSGSTTADANIQTDAGGRKYILRKRGGSGSGSASGGSGSNSSATAGSDYDTVWLYMGTQDRYYTLHGAKDRDTLYYNTDEWNSWWNNTSTDDELKVKSGKTKVKVDDDGSWKVKDDSSKTKMNDKGKVKTKPKG